VRADGFGERHKASLWVTILGLAGLELYHWLMRDR
jgi:hypothetical protein